jgi:Domain of unknown function (DUF4365)
MSPRRPRNQQLQAESRSAFAQLVPQHWAMRHQHEEDVGIDAEVEVFDETTSATTGILFKVQLKATEEQELARALAVEVSVAHWNYYYEQLPLPVLIALYHVPSKTFYARWVHRFDVVPRPDQKTVTLRLSPDDLVDESATERWLDDAIVTVDPRRITISLPPWNSQYGITFRNNSAQVVHDVEFHVLLGRSSSLSLDRLDLEPLFEVDWLFGEVPVRLVQSTEDVPELSNHKIKRMEPRSEYRYRVSYRPEEGESGDPTTRHVEFRIVRFRSEASPVLTS